MTREIPPILLSVLVAGLLLASPERTGATASTSPSSAVPIPAHEPVDPTGRLEPLRAEVDTVLEVRRGDRLILQNVSGHIHVRAVAGDRVRLVTSSPADVGSVLLTRSGDRLALVDRDRKGRSLERNLELEVPRWLPLDLRANDLEVTVQGLRADLSVRNVEGDLSVEDVEGSVTLWSVDGEIRVRDVRGRVTARSVDESVELTRVSGDVEVGSTDGDLSLRQVDADRVDAQTVDGDIDFDGPLRRGGTYTFVTHGGDVTAAVQPDVGARVDVSTFDGSFEADFPVTLERFRGGREMSFTLGDGAARLVLQAFDGDIRLRRR